MSLSLLHDLHVISNWQHNNYCECLFLHRVVELSILQVIARYFYYHNMLYLLTSGAKTTTILYNHKDSVCWGNGSSVYRVGNMTIGRHQSTVSTRCECGPDHTSAIPPPGPRDCCAVCVSVHVPLDINKWNCISQWSLTWWKKKSITCRRTTEAY